MEFLGGGVLGSLIGGLFRLAPELIKFLDRKDERKHELAMFGLQTDLEKLKGTFRMEERYVEHSTAQIDAIQAAFKEQAETAKSSYPWVAAASALVRPGVTYALFGMYCLLKITTLVYALMGGASWLEVVSSAWGPEDFGMLNMILGISFFNNSNGLQSGNPSNSICSKISSYLFSLSSGIEKLVVSTSKSSIVF